MRRRTWATISVCSLVIVVGAGGGVAVAAARYQPLGPGPLGDTVAAREGVQQTLPRDPSSGQSVIDVVYRDGSVVTYGFSLRNTGHWGVRVTEIEVAPASFEALLRPIDIRMDARLGPHDGVQAPMVDAGTVPFQPFDLGPDQDRWIVIRARMEGCEFYEPGGGLTLTGQTVRFTVLGIIEHQAEIAFPQGIEVLSPSRDACPRPGRYPVGPTPSAPTPKASG